MGRYTGTPVQLPVQTQLVPVGGVVDVFRSGSDYKAVGETVLRSSYSELSAAFPRSGAWSYSAVSNVTDGTPGAGAYGNGKFVFVISTSTQAAISTDNGASWYIRVLPMQAYSIAYGANVFVAGVSGNAVFYSTDGESWDSVSVTNGSYKAAVYGGGKFVLLNQGSAACISSTTGTSGWTAGTMPSSANWGAIAYGNGTYVAIETDIAVMKAATSTDAVTWTARTMPLSANWRSVTFENGLFLALGYTSSIVVATSPDGITWTVRKTGLDTNSYSSTASAVGGNGVFIISGGSGQPGAISYDGIKWKGLAGGGATAIPGVSAYGVGVFIFAAPGPSATFRAIRAENLTDSAYMAITGPANSFVRVK